MSITQVRCMDCSHCRELSNCLVSIAWADGCGYSCMARAGSGFTGCRDVVTGEVSVIYDPGVSCRDAHRPSLWTWLTRRGNSCGRFEAKEGES